MEGIFLRGSRCFTMMIVNASFYSDSEIDLPQTGSPLMPTSAGHYALKTLTAFDTIRPYGRRDYQILYVHKGCIYYLEDGEQYVAPEGSVLLYPPATPQYYIYYLKDSPDIYWCHFTGKEVRELLDRLGLSGCLCHQNVRSDTYAGLFEQPVIVHCGGGDIDIYPADRAVFMFDTVNGVDAVQIVFHGVVDRILACFQRQPLVPHILKGDDLFADLLLGQLFAGDMFIF